jgi:AAA domain
MTWDPYIVEEEPAFGEPSSNGDGPQREPSDCDEVSIVSIEEFCSVEEPGAVALVGTAENALIPEDSDIMFYGDGGASKTTLCIDLACHLATPKDWLGHPLANRARVLLTECQGPRKMFRGKLKRKREAWGASRLDGWIQILERPWAQFTFASEQWREEIARQIKAQEIDVLIVGPLKQDRHDRRGHAGGGQRVHGVHQERPQPTQPPAGRDPRPPREQGRSRLGRVG